MKKDLNEPIQIVKKRRDAALAALVNSIPYIQFLGVRFDRRGDELTAVMPFSEELIGNPDLPALHGGAIAAFLEISAVIELSWVGLWKEFESSKITPKKIKSCGIVSIPKTINFSVDYLRTGFPRDAYARACVNRSGRRYASVFVEAWQDNKNSPIAQATGHFLMSDAVT